MPKKAIWGLLLVCGLLAYGGYIYTILRPYFARVELETAWELDYRSEPFSQMHLGDGGTIYLITERSAFIGISPDGQELYRYEVPLQGYSFGFDDGSNDTLWLATMDYVDTSQTLQPGHNHPPPAAHESATAAGEASTETRPRFVARLVGISTGGTTLVDKTFEVGGIVSNLWCMDGKVFFKDSGQNLNCYDEQGNQLWVKNFPKMVDFSKGGNLLFLDCGSDVAAVNTDGVELWRKPMGQGNGLGHWTNWSSTAGRLCLVDNNDFVHVLDFAGKEEWSADLAHSLNMFGGYGYTEVTARIHADRTVYALSGDATLHKYAGDGNELWSFKAGPFTSAFDLGTDGTVYIQSDNKGLLAISSGGKLLWRDGRYGEYYYHSPKVANNGLLYLVQDNKLLALKLPAR